MNLRVIRLLIAVACAWLASAALAASAPGVPEGWSDGFVYANGIRIHYYRAVPRPGKPVIVMVHGVTDNGLSWTTLTEELQASYDIYMLDARGHGLSDPFTDADTGDTLVKDVVGFMRAMSFDKPILMGHSMGAATVMRLGAEYPDLPRAVIMLDPLLGRLPAGVPGRPAGASAGGAAPARRPGSVSMFGTPETLVAQNNDSFEDLLAACGRQNRMWDPTDCQYWALSKKQYHGPYSAAQMQAMRGTMAIEDALARITAPALILKADAPPEVREANLRAASVMRNGKLVHVDGSGHNLHHDKRARTVELLTEFLGRLQTSG
ncbi:alpha/beta hydrolase [Sphingomonas cannabina]|uniref:alpha/beta fold hydrolase n=1 Tax=Sphingomonas cannabina TaxID=2899123 RepID=UPI001F364454|nr:alpha/beta hydrolase [Sphingomonas cannabina]UIJ47302.1 alpha/beta hydrolase [Sphingomonas cannabina]